MVRIYMITKTITIRDEHERWVVASHINLSRFVQDMIGREIAKSRKR